MALLSEKLLMYGRKFSRKDFFVSRQSFPLTNHGGRGYREARKEKLKLKVIINYDCRRGYGFIARVKTRNWL